MCRRILVKGGSGAGKTTLARQLAHQRGLPHVELDAFQHLENWRQASTEEFLSSVNRVLDDARGWVVDGNYDRKLENTLLDRADLVVWLDLPLRTKLVRLARRTSRRYFSQEELWNGNRETLKELFLGRESLFVWAIRSHFRQRRVWPRRFAGRNVVRLRTPSEVAAWKP